VSYKQFTVMLVWNVFFQFYQNVCLLLSLCMHISLIFHKVVWRRIYGVVRSIIITLSQIVCKVCQWKNFENRSIIAKIWTKVKWHVFWPTLYNLNQTQNSTSFDWWLVFLVSFIYQAEMFLCKAFHADYATSCNRASCNANVFAGCDCNSKSIRCSVQPSGGTAWYVGGCVMATCLLRQSASKSPTTPLRSLVGIYTVSPGSAETNVGWGGKLNGHLMASCVRNICTKNFQNLVVGFQVTVENVGDTFLRQCVHRCSS